MDIEKGKYKVLLKKHIFNIPDFQRSYSWTKDNVRVFLKDVLNNYQLEQKYFFGTMILCGGADDEEVSVIDGQQRLITTIILLAVIRDSFIKLIDTDINDDQKDICRKCEESIHENYIIDEGNNGRSIKARINLRDDSDYFKGYIQCKEKTDYIKKQYQLDDNEINLKMAYDYFEKFFLKQYKELSTDSYIQLLEEIRDMILDKLYITVVYVNNLSEAYKIFANINSKGLPLSDIDLIRSYVFEHVGNLGINDNHFNEYLKVWNKAIDKINNISSSKKAVQNFFEVYLTSFFPNVSGKNIYGKFIDIYNCDDKIKEFIENFCDYVDLYNNIFNYQTKDSEKLIIQKSLKNITTISKEKGQIYPLIMTLLSKSEIFDKSKNAIKIGKLRDFILFLSDFYFIVFIVNHMKANNFTSIIKKCNKQIRDTDDSNEISNIILETKKALIDKIDQQLFFKNFQQLEFTRNKDKKNSYYIKNNMHISYPLERIMASKCDKSFTMCEDNSIEHILDKKSNLKDIDNIGNLILLEKRINEKLGIIGKKQSDSNYKIKFYKESQHHLDRFIECKELEDNTFNIQKQSQKYAELYWALFNK